MRVEKKSARLGGTIAATEKQRLGQAAREDLISCAVVRRRSSTRVCDDTPSRFTTERMVLHGSGPASRPVALGASTASCVGVLRETGTVSGAVIGFDIVQMVKACIPVDDPSGHVVGVGCQLVASGSFT